MTTIYKYPLQLGVTQVPMPKDAQVLTAQIQNGTIAIWAIVNTDAELEHRTFTVVGTGHRLPDNVDVSDWIATGQDDQYVWHVFEFPAKSEAV